MSKSPQWDLVSLGEVMLRLDPGDVRISTARSFRAWEGGGEYNVARALRRCFGLQTALVTALVDNPVGRLLEDLILQGGVDQSNVRWVDADGLARNGLNFTERGFGVRPPIGCSDRGHSAASHLQPGQIDWSLIFRDQGARWLHTGGIFAALSESTQAVAMEAILAARQHGVRVSYDLNYRPSLWAHRGGLAAAQQVNRELARHVDVLFGEFRSTLGYEGPERVFEAFPELQILAHPLRTGGDWGGVAWVEGKEYRARVRPCLEIYDRVGGGDAFAAGLIYGTLTGRDPQWSVECGCAHGALVMTTPGDTSMATLAEVEEAMGEEVRPFQR